MALIWGGEERPYAKRPIARRTRAQHVGDFLLVAASALAFAYCYAGAAGWL